MNEFKKQRLEKLRRKYLSISDGRETVISSERIDSGVRKRMAFYLWKRYAGIKDFLFVHVPRTGGSSLGAAIQDRPDHVTAAMMLDVIGKPVFQNLRVFSIVRNTWSRLVSLYLWYDPKRNIEFEQFLNMKEAPFSVSQLYWLTDSNVSRDMNKWSSMSWSPEDEFGDIIVNEIFRYENLAGALSELGVVETLPHLNATNHVHYSRFYSDELRDLVQNNYQDEIERFQFNFEDCRS